MHKIVGLNDRGVKWIGRAGANKSGAPRPQLIESELEDGESLQRQVCIISERKVELNIRRRKKIPRVDEPAHQGRADGEKTRTAEHPFGSLTNESKAAAADRFGALHTHDKVDHVVVLQIRTDAG